MRRPPSYQPPVNDDRRWETDCPTAPGVRWRLACVWDFRDCFAVSGDFNALRGGKFRTVRLFASNSLTVAGPLARRVAGAGRLHARFKEDGVFSDGLIMGSSAARKRRSRTLTRIVIFRKKNRITRITVTHASLPISERHISTGDILANMHVSP